jgi:hypothetical protein
MRSMSYFLHEQRANAHVTDVRRSAAAHQVVAEARSERRGERQSLSRGRQARLKIRLGLVLMRAGGRLSGVDLPDPNLRPAGRG